MSAARLQAASTQRRHFEESSTRLEQRERAMKLRLTAEQEQSARLASKFALELAGRRSAEQALRSLQVGGCPPETPKTH
jgi:hypothetical protein